MNVFEQLDPTRGRINPLLSQPSFFISILVESFSEELVFYSLDNEGHIGFMNKSAKRVLNLEPSEWVGKRFRDFLSDHECNDLLRNIETNGEIFRKAVHGTCELEAPQQPRSKFKYWQIRIFHREQPLGFAGVLYQPMDDETGEDSEALLEMAASLTAVETEVVNFVYESRQNKSIAAELNVAVRTIESRRSRAMSKLKVNSLANLIKLWARVRKLEELRKRDTESPPSSKLSP